MNNLLSGTCAEGKAGYDDLEDVELGEPKSEQNLDPFFTDVNNIKMEMEEMRSLLERIRSTNEESKTVHRADAMKAVRKRMEREVDMVLRKVKSVKAKLDAVDRENAASLRIPGCGPGSSAERTRTATTNALRTSLKKLMDQFQFLRQNIKAEYMETVERRYFTVTGEKASEEMIEQMIESGEGENILQQAIREQGRGEILDVLSEMQQRHNAVREVERNLLELHQIFLDMSVLVEAQGDQMNDIEAQIGKASSFVQRGTVRLAHAKKLQRNTRKWTCIAILIIIIIIIVILVPVLVKK